MPRPDAIGLKIDVDSIETADKVLHELSWIEHEAEKLDAGVKQRVDAILEDTKDKRVLQVDGHQVSFTNRLEALLGPLVAWVQDNIKGHLVGKKKTVDLPHGTLGLRQKPQVVELAEGVTSAQVVDAIDEEADGIVATIRGWTVKKCKNLGCFAGDVVTIDVKPNLTGIKKAFEEKRITREQVESLGLSIREAVDEAVIKPAKIIAS